jgi:hypothetical protein|nr:MAG TPA: hypothetical protein [Bacteriophage sp.]DAZ41772.1 MAG TPA: hypothetical protein [Caudoviricetes sp.]
MVKEFSAISELKYIRDQKSRLSEREQELIKPILSDLGIIPMIFQWYCEIVGNCGLPERRSGTCFRQKFVFIILFLYSPSTLAGGKIAKGIRDILADILGFKSPTGISNLYVNVTFNYNNYKDYRADIDYLYTEIVNRLKFKGLIN